MTDDVTFLIDSVRWSLKPWSPGPKRDEIETAVKNLDGINSFFAARFKSGDEVWRIDTRQTPEEIKAEMEHLERTGELPEFDVRWRCNLATVGSVVFDKTGLRGYGCFWGEGISMLDGDYCPGDTPDKDLFTTQAEGDAEAERRTNEYLLGKERSSTMTEPDQEARQTEDGKAV